MNWETILCLGDSITIGARSYLGFPEYCAALLESETQKNWNVINLSKSGMTTIELHRYLDFVGFSFSSCKPEVINILIGTNDLKSSTSLEDFEIAYRALVVKVRATHPNAFLILNEIPYLLPGVMLPYKTSMNDRVSDFNKIINDIAQTIGVEVLKFQFENSHMFDGVHLNSKGSKHIGETLARKILSIRE